MALYYKDQPIDTRYVWLPEPNDFQSGVIQRCAIGIELGADKNSVLQLCYDEGQTEAHAELTYIAAKLLVEWRRT